jgi:hypothetical protein
MVHLLEVVFQTTNTSFVGQCRQELRTIFGSSFRRPEALEMPSDYSGRGSRLLGVNVFPEKCLGKATSPARQDLGEASMVGDEARVVAESLESDPPGCFVSMP